MTVPPNSLPPEQTWYGVENGADDKDSSALSTFVQVSILTFVVTSMVSMGLKLKVEQITEPITSWKLIIIILVSGVEGNGLSLFQHGFYKIGS